MNENDLTGKWLISLQVSFAWRHKVFIQDKQITDRL